MTIQLSKISTSDARQRQVTEPWQYWTLMAQHYETTRVQDGLRAYLSRMGQIRALKLVTQILVITTFIFLYLIFVSLGIIVACLKTFLEAMLEFAI